MKKKLASKPTCLTKLKGYLDRQSASGQQLDPVSVSVFISDHAPSQGVLEAHDDFASAFATLRPSASATFGDTEHVSQDMAFVELSKCTNLTGSVAERREEQLRAVS